MKRLGRNPSPARRHPRLCRFPPCRRRRHAWLQGGGGAITATLLFLSSFPLEISLEVVMAVASMAPATGSYRDLTGSASCAAGSAALGPWCVGGGGAAVTAGLGTGAACCGGASQPRWVCGCCASACTACCRDGRLSCVGVRLFGAAAAWVLHRRSFSPAGVRPRLGVWLTCGGVQVVVAGLW